MIWESLKKIHQDLKARVLRYWRAREVVKVLRMTHATELSNTPVNMWVVKKAQHAAEIASVRAGKFDIIDRRSWAYPYIPEALHRLNQPILKNTPYNLRRFTETPIPRRALNLVKNALVALKWRISIEEKSDQDDEDLLKEVEVATECLEKPNLQDSWRTLMEAVVEDFLIGGYGTIEPQLTPDYRRPMKFWAVDGSTIRIYADWTEATPDRPHYAQLTGLKGERGIISFLDDELIYIRDNIRSSTPFGLGRMEVAFLTCNAFLSAQDMSSRAGADQIHKTWLWWAQNIPAGHMETVKRHIQNEAEGQAKVSLLAGLPKPEVVEINPVTPEDLLLDWQDFLVRILAAAFELSPMALGLERDVNRNTASVMAEQDFNSAVVPPARKIEETVTRTILHRGLGFLKLKFEFIGLEDPDEIEQSGLMKTLYMVNSVTTDEIRERMQLGAPLPGGWGKLNMAQTQLILAAAVGNKASGGQGAGMGMGGGAGMGTGTPGGGGMGGGMGSTGLPGGYGSNMAPGMAAAKKVWQRAEISGSVPSLYASPFSPQDIAQMDPDTAELYRQAGLLPSDPNQTQTDMESMQPGILQQLSEELLEYFDWLDQIDEENEEKPAKITTKDQKQQAKKFRDRQHKVTVVEREARGRDFRTNVYEQGGYRGPVPKQSKLASDGGKSNGKKLPYTGRTR